MFVPLIVLLLMLAVGPLGAESVEATHKGAPVVEKMKKSKAEWKKELAPEAYRVLCENGTERAFDNEYWNNHETGEYLCGACGQSLFYSEKKFDSGTGWPSFWAPTEKAHIEEKEDGAYGMKRTEVVCSRCGGHLGHLFDDGPQPTGQRYCINSASLKFKKKNETSKTKN